MGTTASNESGRQISSAHQDLSKESGRWRKTSAPEHHPEGHVNAAKGKTGRRFFRGLSASIKDKEYDLSRKRPFDGDLHNVHNRGRNTFRGGTKINNSKLPDGLIASDEEEVMFAQRDGGFAEIRWGKTYIRNPSRSTSRTTSTSSLDDCCSQCSCYEEQGNGDPTSTSNPRGDRELVSHQTTPWKQYNKDYLVTSHSRESIGGKQTNGSSRQLMRSQETRPISRSSKKGHKAKENPYQNQQGRSHASSSSISVESCPKPTQFHTFPALKTKSCNPGQDISRVGHTEGRSEEEFDENLPKNNTSFGENWDVTETGMERPHRPYPTLPPHELRRRQVEDRDEFYRPKDRRERFANREVNGELGEKIDRRPDVRENRRRGNRRPPRIEGPTSDRSSSGEHVTYANGISHRDYIRGEGSSDSYEDLSSVTHRNNTKWKRKSREAPTSREPQSHITRYRKEDYLRQPRKTDARKKNASRKRNDRSQDYLDNSGSIDCRSLKKEHCPVVCLPSSSRRGGHFMQDQTLHERQHQRSVSQRSSLRREECTVPYVLAYDELLSGPFKIFLDCSNQIGGDVASIAKLVQETFINQRAFLVMASKSQRPLDMELPQVLEPTGKKIQEVIAFRESKRQSPFFNHLSAISESIPGLSWVAVAPTPGPYVKEMGDSAIFYTNRVLKEYREKDKLHVEWVQNWNNVFKELQSYVLAHHTTGLSWNTRGGNAMNNLKPAPSNCGVPPPPPPGNIPPPPPMVKLEPKVIPSEDGRAALFESINRGTDITSGLKKVTDDMKTHKNPNLREGPKPFVKASSGAPTSDGKEATPIVRPPKLALEGKKWYVEYQQDKPNLIISQTRMDQCVYIFRCVNTVVQVKGKVNSVILDSCKKSSIVFDNLVSSAEVVNCQSCQVQVMGVMPTLSIEKTDGCQVYLSKESLKTEIISAKSTEMNVLIPNDDGDFTECAIPEQFKTVIKGLSLSTSCTEAAG